MFSSSLDNWAIDSEWIQRDHHFPYHFVVSNAMSIDASGRKIKRDFISYMNEYYGEPGRRWGFRFDRNFDRITLHFHEHDDAVMFRLQHG